MHEMQFTAITIMTLLTLTLLVMVLRRKRKRDFLNLSGWMIAAGTAMLAIQFVLQYVTQFRSMGEVTKSALVNLLFFIPAVAIMNVGMLNLQRQGHLRRMDWLVGAVTWAVCAIILLAANPTVGQPVLTETVRLRTAEYISSALFGLMQIGYLFLLAREDVRMKRALANYYDRDMSAMLRWIELSIMILALMGVIAPPLLFAHGLLLIIYSLIIFFGIYYMVISFVCYSVSSDSQKIQAAEEADEAFGELPSENTDVCEQITENSEQTIPSETEQSSNHNSLTPNHSFEQVEQAVAVWTADGRHMEHELTIQAVADEMKVSRAALSAWLKAEGNESFSAWLTELRIDEAKRMLIAHPDWSNESIADQCGFGDRTYFQKLFRKHTGLTPAQFVKENTNQ